MEDPDEEAVGAEKSPRKVGLFVLGLLVVLLAALGLILLILHHHAPVVQQ